MTTTAPPARTPPIAVVGLGALFPGSHDVGEFWRDIVRGVDRITDVPATHWLPEDYYDPDPAAPDRTYCKRGAFLSPVAFDPLEFGVPPTTVPATDTSQLLALLVARAALHDHAGGPLAPAARARTSVILGVTSGQELLGTMVSRLQRPVWTRALRELGLPEAQVQAACDRIAASYVPWVESSFPGLLGNVVAGRVANRFDLGGTNLVTDAACASTLAAVHAAIHELHAGDADLVLTGGVETSNDIFMFTCFSKTPALSRSGDCRPFSAAADGTMLGEGLGMLVLKRLADAERDGDRIHAVIRGVGTSSDGRAKSIYAPVSDGQARALRRAYAVADVDPATVELLEAHGTGTVAGDLAEFRGLQQVFTPTPDRAQWCALGSVKSQIGHTKAAAGAAGLLKAILAVEHGVLPPTIKVDRPDPRLEIEASAFYLNTAARPWIRDAAHPRRAGVSSFGFGGTNFHVVVEEYTGPAPRAPRANVRPGELVLLSADSPAALASACRDAATLASPDVAASSAVSASPARSSSASSAAPASPSAAPPASLAWLARDSQRRFDRTAPARLAVVARDAAELAALLRAAADALAADRPAPPGVRVELGAPAPGGLALACPGQGSQHPGMGAALALHFEPARRVWDAAATCLPGQVALHAVAFPPPNFDAAAREQQRARLTATEWAQPALAAAGAAALAVLRACGVRPDAAFGHSFGELTALHAAGALDLPTLLRAARRRGEAMRDASSAPGVMTAVSAAIDQVRPLVAAHPDVVLANHNAPRQSVIAGPAAAVERAEADLRAAGLTAQRLAVATAFHSPLVAPASAAFAAALADLPLAPPQLPVISCSEVAPYPDDAATARAWLSGQIARPVRFVEQVEALYARGIRTFLEIGPGNVLTGLIARCLEGRPHRAIALADRDGDGVLTLLRALGELAVAGVALDLGALWAGLAPPREPEPATARLTLPICGANYGKLYPPPGGAAALPGPNPARQAGSADGPPAQGPAPRPPASATPVREDASLRPATPTRAAPPVREDMSPRPAPPPGRPVTEAAPGPSLPTQTATPMTLRPSIPAPSAAWLDAHRDIFSQLAAAQAAYQRSMADSHLAYLQVAHASLSALHGGLGGPLPAIVAAAEAPHRDPAIVAATAEAPRRDPVPALAPPPAPRAAAPTPVPVPALRDVPHLSPGTGPTSTATAAAHLSPGTGPTSAATAAAHLSPGTGPTSAAPAVAHLSSGTGPALDPALASLTGVHLSPGTGLTRTPAPAAHLSPGTGSPADPAALLLAVVADKTGYPAAMLRLDMALESDLGVDSIKRVEILSALREQVPALPDLPPAALGDLRTLGDIVALLAPGSATQHLSPGTGPAAPAADPAAILLAVVADKTGYPAAMLRLDMALESDLGVDSIKRVEILSALREQVPALPDLPPAALGDLRTLGDIVALLAPGSADPPRLAVVAPARPEPAPLALVAPALPGPTPQIGRHVPRLCPAPAAGFRLPHLDRGPIAVTEDGGGIAGALVAELRARDLDVRLVAAPGDLPPDARALIVLDGLEPRDELAAGLDACRRALAFARAFAPRAARGEAVFVTVQDTGGRFCLAGPPRRPGFAGLAAFARTAAHEWPGAACRAIDLERGDRSAAQVAADLARELLHGGLELEVGLGADGSRWTIAAALEPADADAAPLAADGVWVVSGGARGITPGLVAALADRGAHRIVLLGRTALTDEPAACVGVEGDAALKRALLATDPARDPAGLRAQVQQIERAREVRGTLARLARSGAAVRYHAVDLSDRPALAAALADARAAWGPITGLIHAAGVLADRAIADKTDADLDRVLAAKIDGLEALLAATADDPVRELLLFSSIAARTGNPGQCDYAAANEILNKLAWSERARRGAACRVKALGWGPWRGGMVTPELARRFAARGVPLIEPDVGAALLLAELERAPADDVEVVLGALDPAPADAPALTAEIVVGAHEAGPAGRSPPARELRPAALRSGPGDMSSARELRTAASQPGPGDMSHVLPDSHGDLGPDLGDHAPAGTPVLPIALAVEWFARAAAAVRPGRALLEVRGLQVLRGLKLPRLRRGGERLRLTLRPVAADRLLATLTDESGAPGLRAELVCGPARPVPASQAPLGPRADYGGPLFHGPAFQVLGRPERLEPGLAVAAVAGVLAQGWPGAYRSDPAALDGALQLALLWIDRAVGGRALPMAIARLELHAAGPWPGPARCELTPVRCDRSHGTCSIDLVAPDGRPLAALTGVELVVHTADGRELGSAARG